MDYIFDWKKYTNILRKAAAEGCVLLKNCKETLPIKHNETVSVFGRIQFDYYKSGTGSGGMVNAPYVVSILDGLRACKEISINEELVEIYQNWIKEHPFDIGNGWAQEPWSQKEMLLNQDIVETAADKSDIAIIIIGRTAGEDKDNSETEGSYLLTEEEKKMLKLVCKSFTRVAVVLNVGNIIDMKWIDEYNPGAVLYAWQGGMEGGNGVADILTGKVNPSGKLSDTITMDLKDYPSTKNFGDEEKNYYAEDIYVGYRYFETFAKDLVKYPFGFGLSYTNFEKRVSAYTVEGNMISLEVTVTNTGSVAGKETVMIYYCPPQGLLGKPVRNLIRFDKTGLLEPEQSEKIQFTCSLREFASYDDSGVTGHKACYVLEEGSYEIFVGSDVRRAKRVFDVFVEELQVVEQLQEAAAPVREFKRIRPSLKNKFEPCEYVITEENVPTRTVDLNARIRNGNAYEDTYTKDQGYKLADVYDKKITMEKFLGQLTDDELICMTRGEGMCSPKVTAGTAGAFGGVTESLCKYGIPIACCADGPSGIRMDCGTRAFSLPIGTALACSFNVELIKELYEMLGLELRKNKIDMILGPGMNIHRNPLNGRNFEYFSEDPYLTGAIAVAQLQGMHKYGVTGTLKHFACNNQEFKRQDVDAIISERALREIYLKSFEMAVKNGEAYSIMSTYGALNGIWTAGNYDLLTTILRKEWGYTGIVMSDWWAKSNDEGKPATVQNTTAMVRAQNDVFMVVTDSLSNSNNDNTKDGLSSGKITRAELMRNAANICNVVMKSPVMDYFSSRNKDTFDEINKVVVKDKHLTEMDMQVVDGDTKLNIANINTDKGSNILYPLYFLKKGKYKINFKMKSDAVEQAQLPISVFMNDEFLITITVNGLNSEWVSREVEFEVSDESNNDLRLFFGEGGIDMGKISITLQG